jgi:hypothetical protein
MNLLNKSIVDFLSKNQVATVCFTNELNQPYCINCFYSFIEDCAILIFKSSYGTSHDSFIKKNNNLAGTITDEQIDLTKLKGIQFTGKLIDEQEITNKRLNFFYIKKHPMSIALPGYLWGVQLEYIKFTDNSLGFGSKIIWKIE